MVAAFGSPFWVSKWTTQWSDFSGHQQGGSHLIDHSTNIQELDRLISSNLHVPQPATE